MEISGVDLRSANRFEGRVLAVAYDAETAEVRVACEGREIVSLLPRSVAEGMKLQVGEAVTALVNREDVALLKAMRR